MPLPLGPMLSSVGRALTGPTARNVARFGAGGTAGYLANDAYLNQVNPDISDVGRMRSNLFSAALGGTLASRGALPAIAQMAKNRDLRLGLGAGALGLRYGVIMPDMEHAPIGAGQGGNRIGLGLGDVLDPGKSKFPRIAAHVRNPVKLDQTLETASKPLENATAYVTDKAYDRVKADLEKNKGQASQWLAGTALPATYGSLITALGGQPGEKPTLSDVGMAAVPHITGGAGGAYLGHLLGGGVGRFFFKDDPKADYEERRRQEQRRWWLQFLGANLGAVGGVYGAMNAAPHLNKLIGSAMATKQGSAADAHEKQAVGIPTTTLRALFGRTLGNVTRAGMNRVGQGALGLGKDMALAGAMTGAQYATGIVPPGSYDGEGVLKQLPQNRDLKYMAALYGTNLLAARTPGARGLLSGNKAFARPANTPATAEAFQRWKYVPPNPVMRGLTLAAATTAAPSVVNLGTAVPPLVGVVSDPEKLQHLTDNLTKDTGGLLGGSAAFKPEQVAKSVMRGAQRLLATKPVTEDLGSVAKDVVDQAGVPGVSDKGNQSIKDMLGSTGLSMLAQGAGMATGGVAGLTAGDWLVDKLLTTAVNKKWLKKRKGLHQFLRDLGSVAGAGLGAYGGLKALNYGVPAAANYYNKHLAGKTASHSKAAREFYHGTASKNIAAILRDGLDPAYAGTGADSGVPKDIPGYEQRVFLATHPQINSGYGDARLRVTLPEDFPVRPLFPWPISALMTDHYTTAKIPPKYLALVNDKEKQARWEKISFELPELDIRLPDATQAARMTAIAALVSGVLGAGRGAYDPGYDEKLNRRGHIIAKTRRNRLRGAGIGGLIGVTTGAGGSYASQVANQYRPEIDRYLHSWMRPGQAETLTAGTPADIPPNEGLEVAQPLFDTITHTA